MIRPVVQMDSGRLTVPSNYGRASPPAAVVVVATSRVSATVRRTVQHNIPGIVLLRHSFRRGHVLGPRPPPGHPGRFVSPERILRRRIARGISGNGLSEL